jgi:CRP-like cAMP-binding protein
MNQNIQSIRPTHFFSALSDQQFNELADKSYCTSLKKDEVLFNVGDASGAFYVLLSGKLKLSLNSLNGAEKILTIVRPQDMFAEAVMFLEKKQYPVNCTALQDSEVFCFDSKVLISFLRACPDLALKMLSILSARLHKQIHEIENLSSQNSMSRVFNYISSLITNEQDNRATVTLDTSKKNLASRLSITPETLSRTLHKASKDKILEINGKVIFIPNMRAFRSYLIGH